MPSQADNSRMNKSPFRLLSCALLGMLLHAQPAHASAPQQSHAEIRTAVETFVRAQTLTLPGQVNIKVNHIDKRIALPACPSLETFLPPGAQLFGNSTVGVRCVGTHPWKLFVQVHVKVSTRLLIASQPLQQGQVLRAEDISSQNGELTQAGMLTDPAQAIGKILNFSIGAGQVLKQDMLRAPYVVMQGQTVQLQIEEQGFSIRSEGRALNNAADGQNVQIRTPSGQVVSGVAKADGTILKTSIRATENTEKAKY
jgi:flagella basal body P-ring formation protein FlgA